MPRRLAGLSLALLAACLGAALAADLSLPARQQQVREDSLRQAHQDMDGLVQRYLQGTPEEALRRGPVIVSADAAKELFPSYASGPGNRALYAGAVQDASVEVSDEVWGRLLRARAPPGVDRALLLAGGAGSGKTYALSHDADLQGLSRSSHAIFDAALTDLDLAARRVRQALDAHLGVDVVYVYAPIEVAARRVIDRAGREGRALPSWAVAGSHWRSQRVVLDLQSRFAGDRRVRFFLLGGPQERLAPLDGLRAKLYGDDPRFPDEEHLVVYVQGLMRRELARLRSEGQAVASEIVDGLDLGGRETAGPKVDLGGALHRAASVSAPAFEGAATR